MTPVKNMRNDWMAWAIFAGIGFALICYMALRDRRSDRASVTTLSGAAIDGVVTDFMVAPQEIARNQPVTISMNLKNVSSEPKRFRCSACIEYHIEIIDATGVLVHPKEGSPILECPFDEMLIQPGATVHKVYSINLWTLYSLSPGRFEVRFKYDTRLLGRNASGNAWIPWVQGSVPILVV
jgi:hypothetical protein